MKVIAIESSSRVASVAVMEDDQLIANYTLNDKLTHSQTIMPMLASIKEMIGLDLKTVDGIIVSSGPGSYTGLRIGSATAKGLAQVLELPIVGISTIESLAHNIGPTNSLIVPMLDARRQHVYCGVYAYEGSVLENLLPIDLRSVEDLSAFLLEQDRSVIILGDGAVAHKALVEEFFAKLSWSMASSIHFNANAGTLAYLGIEALRAGNTESYMDHQPDYYRPSSAERTFGS